MSLAAEVITRLCALWYGSISEKIFFLHLPKCGGTSLDSALRRMYPCSCVHITGRASHNAATAFYQLEDPVARDLDRVLDFREHLLLYYMSKPSVQYVSGHVRFSDLAYQEFRETFSFVTLLRDPVQRWISSYFFHRYRKIHPEYIMIEEDLPAFMQTERAKNEGALTVRLLAGPEPSGDYASPEAVAQAKANLHKFEVVGCLEQMDDFLQQFTRRFGVHLSIPQKNKNPTPSSQRTSRLTPEIYEEIVRLCQPDIAVYQYALDTFIRTQSS